MAGIIRNLIYSSVVPSFRFPDNALMLYMHIIQSRSKMSSEYDPVKMCSECQPVKETTQHPNCKAVPLSNTVFIDLPVTTSVTVFVKLPAFASNLVYEDTSNTLVCLATKKNNIKGAM